MEVIPRSRVPFHLFSNVYLWFIIVIYNPDTTQRDTKFHTLGFIFAWFKIDVVRIFLIPSAFSIKKSLYVANI